MASVDPVSRPQAYAPLNDRAPSPVEARMHFPPSAPIHPPVPAPPPGPRTCVLPFVAFDGIIVFTVPESLALLFERRLDAMNRRLGRRYGPRVAATLLRWLAEKFAALPTTHQTPRMFRALTLLVRLLVGRPVRCGSSAVFLPYHPDDHILLDRALQALGPGARRAVKSAARNVRGVFAECRREAIGRGPATPGSL